MILNDVLRRIRYIFDLDDFQMIEVFAAADHAVSREQVCAWLKQEEDEGYSQIPDRDMAIFLNGFINMRRGKRDGEQPEPEDRLSNNMVMMKLRIALNLQSDDVLALLQSTGLRFSAHELSALFRKPGHKHFRKCEDQILRNFLKGLQIRLRPQSSDQVAAAQVTARPEKPAAQSSKDNGSKSNGSKNNVWERS